MLKVLYTNVCTYINDRHCQPGWLSLAAADDRPTDQRTKKKQLSLPKPSKPLHRSCRCRTLPRRKAVLLLLLRSIFELGICPVLLLGMLTEKEGSRKEGRKEITSQSGKERKWMLYYKLVIDAICAYVCRAFDFILIPLFHFQYI